MDESDDEVGSVEPRPLGGAEKCERSPTGVEHGGELLCVDRPDQVQEPASTVAVGEADPPSGEAETHRKLLYVTLPGCWGALIFACLSFTPSLLPRGGIIQGLVCGITGAIGYGLGVLAAWIWRAFADRDPRPARRRSWRIFVIRGVVLLVAAFALGQYWQSEIRDADGCDGLQHPARRRLTARRRADLRRPHSHRPRRARLYRWVARMLKRWIGPRAARRSAGSLAAASPIWSSVACCSTAL